ncbi:MAG TPA: T9SS type A sorting domain-containing protein [Bacteroidota bacterium]|nr:T9SS type A sorting domain-containing protein [Bacteroidota bacterium]
MRYLFLSFVFLSQSLAQTPVPVHDKEYICGTGIASDPELLQQAWENTRRADPGILAAMQRYALQKSAQPLRIGTEEVFWVYNFKDNRFDTVRAELKAIGTMSYVWVALGELSNGHVTQTEVDAILSALENRTPPTSQDTTKGILPLERRFFGNPPNINSSFIRGAGDGRTHFLIYDIIDGFSGSGGFVAGYFHSKDQVNTSSSNRRDMLYIDATPGIFFNNTRDPNRPLNVLAHEFQHLIHWNYDTGESTFINEGLSELAELLCGYGLRSPERYLKNTNVSLLGWSQTTDDRVLADYSRAALFTYYLWDQFGEVFVRNLTQNPESGALGFDSALLLSGYSGNLVSTVKNFQIANYVMDRSVGQSYGYGIPLQRQPRPKVHLDTFGPTSSGSRTNILSLGAEYLRFRVMDTVRAMLTITSGIGDIQVIRASSGGTTVSSVPAGLQYESSFVGSPISEAVFVVHNTRTTGNLAYTHQTTGALKSGVALELAHDDGRTQRAPNTLFRPNDTLSVAFDGVSNAKIDSVAMWFQTTGSARLMVRDWNTAYDLSTQPLGGLGGAARISSPIPFTVTDTSFLRTVVDLRQRNISASNDFLVQVLYGAGAPNPLMRRDSGQSAVRSFLFLSSQPTAGRLMYESTGDFYVRVYLGYSDQSTIPPPSSGALVLQQSYPNPLYMRGSTSTALLEYSVPIDGNVRLVVYDLLGRPVRVLLDRFLFAGFYSIEWDGRDAGGGLVPSGVYLYRLESGGDAQTRKLILVR